MTANKDGAKLGLEDGEVRLAHYDPQWPVLFSQEEKRLRSLFKDDLVDVQHIGSTAIPDVMAKPIIDIALALKSLEELDALVSAMGRHDYGYKGEYGLPGRHFFTKGNPVSYHVHMVQWPSPHWSRWIIFRDRLRTDHALRNEYLKLKAELLEKFSLNRKAYTAAKDPFISKVVEKK